MQSFHRYFGPVVGLALAAGFASWAVSCASSYTIRRQTRRHYPQIVAPEEVRCFVEAVPEEGFKTLAVVDSESATTVTLEAREAQLAQLREAASKVGATTLYGIRLLTRQTRGVVRDPAAPSWAPTPTQGWTDEYFLRGEAALPVGMSPDDMPEYATRPARPGATDQPGEASRRVELDPGPSPNVDPSRTVTTPGWSEMIYATEHRSTKE